MTLFLYGCLLALGAIGLDQLTKHMILGVMNPPHVWTICPIFDLVLVFNHGISFGMFQQGSLWGVVVLILVAVGITLFLLSWLKKAQTRLLATGLGLVIGGAIGNIIDRIRFSSVVDFLHFHWDQHSFPAFNGADAFITLGVGLILIDEFLHSRRKKHDSL